MNDAQLALIDLHDTVLLFLRRQIARDARLLRRHGASHDEIRAVLEVKRADYHLVEAEIMDAAVAFVLDDLSANAHPTLQ